MLQLHSFHLRNYGLWRSVDFAFQPGVTLVTGPNRSGKTLLFRGLKQALRAKPERVNSSLSRLPEGSSITVRLTCSSKPWQVKLTPKVLSLVEDGRDQQSKGKRASKALLSEVLSIPPALFDSTVHVTGLGSHPLIDGTPVSRLAWVSSVLDLTGVYDDVAMRVDRDLKVAVKAAAQADALLDEYDSMHVPSNLPDVRELRSKLSEARKEHSKYSRAAEVANRLLEVSDAPYSGEVKERLRRCEDRVHLLRRLLRDAETYEVEEERAKLVSSLKSKLASLTSPVVDEDTVRRVRDVVTAAAREVEDVRRTWSETAKDRARLSDLRGLLRDAPVDLEAARDRVAASLLADERRLDGLSHVEGPSCPLCSARLDATRRRSMLREVEESIADARVELKRLERWLDLSDESRRLSHSTPRCVRPPSSLEAVARHVTLLHEDAVTRRSVARRIEDLRPSGVTVDPPDRSSADLSADLRSEERKLDELRRMLDRATERKKLRATLQDLAPGVDPSTALRRRDEAAESLERLLVEVTSAERQHEEASRLRAERGRLGARIDELEDKCARLPELQELKLAMGRRGLRLTKVRDLLDAFTSEFNALAPLLWTDPFVIDAEVSDSGVDVFASRRGQRADLHSLSGSEVKGFKMLSALALIHLLPDRLRSDTLVCDELEANLDDEHRRRFAEDLLPVLSKSVPKVVIVSPLTYQDVALPFARRYRVRASGTQSELVEV